METNIKGGVVERRGVETQDFSARWPMLIGEKTIFPDFKLKGADLMRGLI